MTALKNNIASKSKSLKRRRGGFQLKETLNSLASEVGNLIDFVRRLSQSHVSEGRQLYDTLVSMPDLNAGQEVWKRVIRAWSFEAG